MSAAAGARGLRPQVTRERALRRLRPWRLLFWPWRKARKAPAPRLELVWLPTWLLQPPGAAGEAVGILVDGHGGGCLGRAGASLWQELEQVEFPLPALSARAAAEEAIALLRRQRRPLVAAAAGASPALDLVALSAEAELVHYPYWVYTFARWRGRVDVRVLDAVSGEPAGPRRKAAFLSAALSQGQRG